MGNNLVSILLPFKNTEKYLPECLNSIIDQTYTNWELIAIDDHSSDESLSILNGYASKDVRIKVLANQGNGIIEALKTGYQFSNGNLISRMDSDDKMTSDKIQKLVSIILENGPKTLATGKVAYFSDAGIGEGYKNYQNWLNQLTTNENNFSEIYRECSIPSPCWMVSKKNLDECEAFNHNTYPEDYDLAFRFYKNGLEVKTHKEVIHYWRDYPQRTSRNNEHYQDNRFIDLKVNYFVDLELTNQQLILWGAGKKGKMIAQKLNAKQVDYNWVCNNEKKIGKDIYGVLLEADNIVLTIKNPLVIVAVAAPNEQIVIKNWLESKKINHVFFC